MIKKDVGYKWNHDEKESFDCIKKSIAEAHSMYNPDFNKDFILYTFVSDSSLAVVLTQKDGNNDE